MRPFRVLSLDGHPHGVIGGSTPVRQTQQLGAFFQTTSGALC